MVEVQDRGSTFRVGGVRLDSEQEDFRSLLAEVVQAQVREVGVEQVSRRSPIAQNGVFIAMPPHYDDNYFCVVSDGEHFWEFREQRELINILQRI